MSVCFEEADPYAHLGVAAKQVIGLEGRDRIAIAKSPFWIPNGHVTRLLEKLEYLMSYPRSVDAPNLLIVGRSGNGKTSLIEELCRRHPPDANINGESCSIPIVRCEIPPTIDLGGFYNEILDSLGLPADSGRVDGRRLRVQHTLRLVGARLLVIDEIHHGNSGGRHTSQVFLNAIKSLSNHLRIPIVCLGTREALALFNRDEQMRRRFAYDELASWKLDKEWRRLLVSYERVLPLRLSSNLAAPELARLLHGMSMGTIGRLAQILASSASKAIESGTERITADILTSADLDALSYEKPRK